MSLTIYLKKVNQIHGADHLGKKSRQLNSTYIPIADVPVFLEKLYALEL